MINIIHGFDKVLFIHQLDQKRYDGYIAFYENSDLDIVWDYLVVYESIKKDYCIKCRQGGLIFISGEPQNSSPYCKAFLKQFDHIISSHNKLYLRNNYLSQQALNWHFGYSYKTNSYKYDFDYLKGMKPIAKIKNISMICSSSQMLPGHIHRFKLYQFLSAKYRGQIDFFGSGIRFVDDKADAILPYRFHICIENSEDNHYWTEKIADAILGYAIPIYCGAPNITDYFSENALIKIDINDYNAIEILIKNILENPEKTYQKHFDALLKARDILLNNYNIFPVLEDFTTKCKLSHPNTFIIKPCSNFLQYKIRLFKLRCYRFSYKLIYIIKKLF